jgi:dTDP-4-dehydrorhamnose reductase
LKNENLKYFLIRTSKLFGPKGESEFAKSSFFDVMLNLAKTKDKLEVVDEELSCFTYTPDLAQVTKTLLEENYHFGIYHIINDGAVSWYQAVIELFKIKNIEIEVIPVGGDKFPRPAKRPMSSILQNTRFPKLRNYKEALTEYLKK